MDSGGVDEGAKGPRFRRGWAGGMSELKDCNAERGQKPKASSLSSNS